MQNENLDTIYFGAGCFWCVEAIFQQVNGVEEVTPGYCGGAIKNPTYNEVCSGKTGHAEVAKIVFNPSVVDLAHLLEVFWKTHDPTTLNRQGNDIGTQYRSVIYVNLPEEMELIKKSMTKFQFVLDRNELGKIKTEINILEKFYMAEEYHQKYLHKNPNGYCGLQGLNLEYF